jgi:glycosyltransferase involved in cell wall biosynthesis
MILKSADLFLITNDYDRKYFPKKLKNKIFSVYGGVNLEEIKIAKQRWNGEKKYDAVFCSRLHTQKGISIILDIWSSVVKDFPNLQLAIIGNGEKQYELFLREKAKKLGIDNNIKWLGYINGLEKYDIYLKSKVFLHGTIYDNNGMVAAEALCTGIPVIMFDLPQLKNVYTIGCIKVDFLDLDKYKKSIINVIDGKNINTKISDLESKKIMKYWSWKNRIKSIELFLINR